MFRKHCFIKGEKKEGRGFPMISIYRGVTVTCALCIALLVTATVQAQSTVKPKLYGKHWMAMTGKESWKAVPVTPGTTTVSPGNNSIRG
jgi:hypothetical protein